MKWGSVMHEHLAGAVLGVAIIVAVAGAVTLGCFVAMFRMLFRAGETDPHHPKYEILHDDH
jgi:hypothetical protein